MPLNRVPRQPPPGAVANRVKGILRFLFLRGPPSSIRAQAHCRFVGGLSALTPGCPTAAQRRSHGSLLPSTPAAS